MNTYILILALATLPRGSNAGTASISQEFNTQESCIIAGNALVKNLYERGNHVLTWGCFKK